MATGNQPTASNDTFGACLKQVRTRIRAKQCWLGREIGCSDAAISQWECGSRLPGENNMRRLFQALDRGGAFPTELVSLVVAWRNDLNKRSAARSG